jgi:hypothetical protein
LSIVFGQSASNTSLFLYDFVPLLTETQKKTAQAGAEGETGAKQAQRASSWNVKNAT